jgi:hypothetical protein
MSRESWRKKKKYAWLRVLFKALGRYYTGKYLKHSKESER